MRTNRRRTIMLGWWRRLRIIILMLRHPGNSATLAECNSTSSFTRHHFTRHGEWTVSLCNARMTQVQDFKHYADNYTNRKPKLLTVMSVTFSNLIHRGGQVLIDVWFLPPFWNTQRSNKHDSCKHQHWPAWKRLKSHALHPHNWHEWLSKIQTCTIPGTVCTYHEGQAKTLQLDTRIHHTPECLTRFVI